MECLREPKPLKRPNIFLYDEPAEKKPRLGTQVQSYASVFHEAAVLDAVKVLYDHFKSLKEDMEALEVARLLKKNGVLDVPSFNKIVCEKTRRRRVDALIKALQEAIIHNVCTGNVQVYTQFLEALTETGQADIRAMLHRKVTPYQPVKHENDRLIKMFTKKNRDILNEIEPLDIIDEIVVLRGLNFHEHEEIMEANCRKQRVDLLNKHLISLRNKQSWRILKPMSDKYKKLFSDPVEIDTPSSTSKPLGALASTGTSGTTSASAGTSLTTLTLTTSLSSEGSGTSIALKCNLRNRKCSIPISETTEHDHPAVQLSKIRAVEKKAVDKFNSDPEKSKDALGKQMEELTLSVNGLSFSSIKIHLQSNSDTSLEQLKECCQDERAKSWILSLLDEESVQRLKDLEATSATLEIFVDEREDFLHIFDEFEEGCLCVLNSANVECNANYVLDNLEDLEISFIEKVLGRDILTETQEHKLKKIKECVDNLERRKTLLEFLLKEDLPQKMYCLLEEEMMMGGKAEVIIRIQQTKTCKTANDPKNITTMGKEQITVSDVREYAEILEDEIDPRWFINSLQTRSDAKSLTMLKNIQESRSRTERTKPFLEYLYEQDDLHWFTDGLEIHNKHLLDIFKREPEESNAANLKLAFLSAYDDIVDDMEPIQVVKQLPSSVLDEIDMTSLKNIRTRQRRASFFIRKILGGSDPIVVAVLEAMKHCYSGLVTTIEKILEAGSLFEKYKCPRIRRVHGKSSTCVFSTDISLFESDVNKSVVEQHPIYSLETVKKSSIAHGFVEANIAKYDKNIKNEKDVHWASYNRYKTNIGVIGAKGTCKLPLLDALCGRIETDEETAPIYVETNLKKFGSYKEARNVTFWDLPEIGNEQFPRRTYLKDVDFKRYDCFVILVPGKFKIDDNILIARELAHLHRKVLLISTSRSNVLISSHVQQQPVAHCSSANAVTEKQVVDAVRKKYCRDLEVLGCTETSLFLINEDAILSNDYDFDKLIARLTEEVDDDKHMI